MTATSPGWEQRMAATRAEVVRVALELFEVKGFDAVPVTEVARAAGVAERTIYRHFPTKESIVLDEGGAAFDDFVDALHAAPTELSPAQAIAATTRHYAALDGGEDDARRVALLRSSPSLQRAWSAMLEGVEPKLRSWLAARTGLDADSIELRSAAAALLAVHRVVVETAGGVDRPTYLERYERALRTLDGGLAGLGP